VRKPTKWQVRKRQGVGAQFQESEIPLDVKRTDTIVIDLGDYKFLIRPSPEGILLSAERGKVFGPPLALRISQPYQVTLWAEHSR
jgi:hypothetical protein